MQENINQEKFIQSSLNNMEFERKNSIDILRCIALLGIIIIHCGPTSLIVQQLRGFDVPLMVFLSGVSYKISSNRNKSTYKQYLWRRFKRLIVPTWLFITFYIVLYWNIQTISISKHIHWF